MFSHGSFSKGLLGVVLAVLFLSAAASAAGPASVNLGSAGNFAILGKSGVSTTGTTFVLGDIGVSPIDSTALTGFGLIADASNQFSTSSLVTGKLYASNYAPPTPTMMTTAISDMQTAYTDAAGRTLPDHTELGAGNIGGMTLSPGLYKWGTGVTIPTDLTLSGGPNDVWIFQIAQTLGVANGVHINLAGGAQSQNVFWQVAGQATLGTTSDVKGIILSQVAIVLNTGAKLNGRALAQSAVTMDASAVTAPSGSGGSGQTPTPTIQIPNPTGFPTLTPSPTMNPTARPTAIPTATVRPTAFPTPRATTTTYPYPTAKPTVVPPVGVRPIAWTFPGVTEYVPTQAELNARAQVAIHNPTINELKAQQATRGEYNPAQVETNAQATAAQNAQNAQNQAAPRSWFNNPDGSITGLGVLAVAVPLVGVVAVVGFSLGLF